MHNFKELSVWQKAMKLVTDVYQLTQLFPQEEKFGLTSQIRRCAVSIPSNIAEGAGRRGKKEFSQFLSFSYGSQYELETQLMIAVSANLVEENHVKSIISDLNEVQKMTYTLIEKFS